MLAWFIVSMCVLGIWLINRWHRHEKRQRVLRLLDNRGELTTTQISLRANISWEAAFGLLAGMRDDNLIVERASDFDIFYSLPGVPVAELAQPSPGPLAAYEERSFNAAHERSTYPTTPLRHVSRGPYAASPDGDEADRRRREECSNDLASALLSPVVHAAIDSAFHHDSSSSASGCGSGNSGGLNDIGSCDVTVPDGGASGEW